MTSLLNLYPHPLCHAPAASDATLGANGPAMPRDRQHEREPNQGRVQSGTATGLRLLLGAAAIATLPACEPTSMAAPTSQTPAGALPAESSAQSAPPKGTAPLELMGAMLAYQTICLDTLPRFAGAEEVVQRQGMAQNPTTGTWYDPNRDLSVNVLPRGGRPACSIIFASNESPQVLSLTLGVATASSGQGSPEIGIDLAGGGASAATGSGAEMLFETGIGGRANLHRVVLTAGR